MWRRGHHGLELYLSGSGTTTSTTSISSVPPAAAATAHPVIGSARYRGKQLPGNSDQLCAIRPPGVFADRRVQDLEGDAKGRDAHQERRRHEVSFSVLLLLLLLEVFVVVVVVVAPHRRIDAVVGDALAALGYFGSVSTAGPGLFVVRAALASTTLVVCS